MPTTINEAALVSLAMLGGLIIYALFGGADYGAGVWDLLARGPRAEAQRRVISKAIGPVWEANHVWLILVIVLLFSAFPVVFSVLMIHLHLPLVLMLLGIVLRGSAFTFRAYDNTESAHRRWGGYFAIPSLTTPIFLGVLIGTIATGQLESGVKSSTALLGQVWLSPFPWVVGLFALNIFAFLAAVYLTLETDDPAVQNDFRRKALGSGMLLGPLALIVYLVARLQAPLIYEGLDSSPWGFPVRVATGVFAVLTLLSLYFRWFQIARAGAMIQVSLILLGCALAQAPYLVPPHRTLANSAAPITTLRFLLYALVAGSIILFPSILLLLRVFKWDTLPNRPKAEEVTDSTRHQQADKSDHLI